MNGQKNRNTPVIVDNTDWPLPESLIKDIKEERMVNALINMICPLSIEEQISWAECVAYLMPLIQKSVMKGDITDIYLYCCNKLMERKRIKDLDFLENHKELSEYQMGKLNKMKRWIYNERGGKEKNPVISALKEVFFNSPYE